MSEDKIEFAKDLVASNISKANKEESSSLNNDDISTICKKKHCTTDNQNTIGRCNELIVGRVYWYNIAYTKIRKMQGKNHHENRLKIITINNGSTPISVKCC